MTPALSPTPLLQKGDAVLAQVRAAVPPAQAPDTGMLGIRGNDALNSQSQREQQAATIIQAAFAGDQRLQDSLAGYLHRCWEDARRAKAVVQQELLKCHRQRVGEYEPDLMAQIRGEGSPEVYVMLTDIKCRAVEAWMREILLSGTDDPWDIHPTPVQDIPPMVADAMVAQAWELTNVQGFSFDQFQQLLKDARARVIQEWGEESEVRAGKMKKKIQDQLDEGDWEKAFSQFLTEFATYPAAFLLGPQLREKKRLKYTARGKFRPEVVREVIPTWESVSAFDVYPQPGIADIGDGYVILHSRMDRKRLLGLKNVEGCREDVLTDVLTKYGQTGYTSWLGMERNVIDMVRGNHNPMQAKAGMFDVLRFFGSVPGQMLVEWGLYANGDDLVMPDDEYDIEAWLIGNQVVYCRINSDPLGRKPLMKACSIEVPGQFWGHSVPFVMRHVQYICNAAARALVENMGMASGPQVALDSSQLAPGESTVIKPWKVWPVAVAGNNGQLPINFFQPDLHAAELMGIFEKFSSQADEVTGIPAYTYGGDSPGGAGNTAAGLSMLMGAAGKGVRQMVSSCDRGVIRENITRLYDFNMEFDPDDSIKGDVRIVAAGAVAIMQKETLRMRRIEFLGLTANPIDMGIIGVDGRAEVLRSVADSLEMNTDRVVPSREEMVQRRQQEEQQAQVQAAMQRIAAMQGGGQPPVTPTSVADAPSPGAPTGAIPRLRGPVDPTQIANGMAG